MVHAACWAHARRKAFDAVKLNPEDRMAAQLVARIDELFAVDAEARDVGMDHGARHVLRGERSRRLLDVMKKEMEAAQAAVFAPLASALGKGVSYTLSPAWEKLTRFLEHPELELSNAGRRTRCGRWCWDGRTGSMLGSAEQAGPKVAAVLSVVETCRRLQVPVREYLAWVFCLVWEALSVQRVHLCYTPTMPGLFPTSNGKMKNKGSKMDWQPLESKLLAASAYDAGKHILYLRFRSGDVYRYAGFPEQKYPGCPPGC